MVKTENSHTAINVVKFIRDSQNYDILHYSPAFLSRKKDLADTKEMSRNKARNTAVLILLMCTQPERSQINSYDFQSW